MLLDELMQTLAFASQHDHRWRGEVRFAVNLVAALVQSINPKTLLFQPLQCLADVADAHHGKVLECARGGLCNCFGESGGSAIGD